MNVACGGRKNQDQEWVDSAPDEMLHLSAGLQDASLLRNKPRCPPHLLSLYRYRPLQVYS